MTQDSIEQASRELMDRVWLAHSKREYNLLLEAFADSKDAHIPGEAQFYDAVDRAITPLGKSSELIYLGQVNKAKAGETMVLWKVSFEATDEELLWHIYLDAGNNLKAIWFG
ncbi:hypothetical protein [Planctobacterium marinum]|uniref:Uncharacterized protein n=1 Tax=Planctobacterium marinum TaxID=1631968 RepID=A0AA48I5X8_9ALTE|nr:hypothetical protein MACH26_20310 [Planctobacterium marinum]